MPLRQQVVSKIYRQVLIDPTQITLQCILWRDLVDEPIKIFEVVTVTYGNHCNICCIVSSNQSSEETCRRLFEPISSPSKIALRDFYVDDLMVTGANIEEQAIIIKEKINQLLQEGGFD